MKRQRTCADQLAVHAEEVRRIQEDYTDPDNYFYSLVIPYEKEKKRTCLRCHKFFRSNHRSSRICSKCEGLKVGGLASFSL